MIKLAIFDMDGTICDTIEDLGTAVNYALARQGYEQHQIDEYKYFVGNGMSKLIERALPKDASDEDKIKTKEIFLGYYKNHFTDKTKPYEGIIQLLEQLKSRNVGLAVCTNKAHPMALKVAEVLFPGQFDVIVGQTDRPMKPDPGAVFEIMQTFGVLPDETVFIGDSDVDMQTAANSKTHGIGVSWGFRTKEELEKNGAEFFASTPADIIKYIDTF